MSLSVEAQQAVREKLSPLLRAKYMSACYDMRYPEQCSIQHTQAPLYVFVKTTGDVSDLYAANGCAVLATFGDIDIVRLPQRAIAAVAQDRRVARMEMGRVNHLTNAATADIIRATQAHEGMLLPQAYTGRGVVVGVQDVGFDLTNPNFYSSDMSDYRIRALWDMLSTDTIDSRLPIGNDYCDASSLLSYAHSRDALTELHGSHTLGTAAGSGYGSAYQGMAYDSDICLVANIVDSNSDYLPDPDATDMNSTALTALGFKYIFDYADAVDMPCVISFSEGAQQGFEEDDLLYYEVLDYLVGEGHIIVASAGNNNQNADYFHKPAGQERAGTFAEKYENQLYFLAQGSGDYTARVAIYGSATTYVDIPTAVLRNDIDSIFTTSFAVDDTDYTVMYVAYPSCYDAENIVMECLIMGPNKIGYASGQPVSIEVQGVDADVEVYSVIGNFVENAAVDVALCAAEASHDVVSPGAAPSVICVGATAYSTGYVNMAGTPLTYDYGEEGVRATFSSVGPTVDGRTKPDVMAPGTNIISSTNSYYFEANPTSSQWSDLVEAYAYDGRAYYWKADTGTSMSTPFVAGAIALWLEAKPTLTREEIIDIFAATCTHPDPSLSYPNDLYGYGQIDVYGGLLRILGIDKIDDISGQQPSAVHFCINADLSLTVSFDMPLTKDAVVNIYAVSGQQLQTASASAGTTTLTIPLRPARGSSVVVVQVWGDSPCTTGSTLLRP